MEIADDLENEFGDESALGDGEWWEGLGIDAYALGDGADAMFAREAVAHAPSEEDLRTCGHQRVDESAAVHFPAPGALPPEPFALLSATQRDNIMREEDAGALVAAAVEGLAMTGVEVRLSAYLDHLRTTCMFAQTPVAAVLYPDTETQCSLALLFPINRQMRYHAGLALRSTKPDQTDIHVMNAAAACTYRVWPATYYIFFFACACTARDEGPPLGLAGGWPVPGV